MMRPQDGPTGRLSDADGEVQRRRSPYFGLKAFGDSDDDAALFFGRSSECELVVANLRSSQVTVVYGPSGVGKSSLLHAGVVHRLRAISPSAPVTILDNWDADPTAEMVAAIIGDRAADPESSVTAAIEALRRRETESVILILDQFEDCLRRHRRTSLDRFSAALGHLVDGPELLARVLIAVRDDRLADLDRFERDISGLFGQVLRLEPMARQAAREAIEKPLEWYNQVRAADGGGAVALEPGLTDEILDELGQRERRDGRSQDPATAREQVIEPAFLSLAMESLWRADIDTGGTMMRRETLRSIGGATQVFATHLDATMAALPAGEQRLGAGMLRFLVTPSGVIQRYSAVDLASYVGRRRVEVESLAESLSRSPARLLRTVAPRIDGPAEVEYELAHDLLAEPALEWQRKYHTGRLERRSRRLLLALVAVSAVAVALAGYVLKPGPLDHLESSSVDARFSLRGAESPDRSIVLVTASSSKPPRAAVAQALDNIATATPRATAVHIFFPGAKTPAGDAAIIRAVRRLGPHLVLATHTLNALGETELFGRLLLTDSTAPAAGFSGFPGNPNDPNAVERTMERSVVQVSDGPRTPLDTLAVATARIAGVPKSTLARLPPTTWIAFRGGAGTFPQVRFEDVLAGRPSALAQLHNRIVVLGITWPGTHDVHDTSAPGRSVMTGPEVQANAISTALRGFPLRNGGLGVDVALIVLLGLVPFALALRLGPALCALGVLGAAGLFCLGAQIAFSSGRVVNIVYPLLGLTLSGIGMVVLLALHQRTTRRRGPKPIAAVGAKDRDAGEDSMTG